MDTTQAGAPLRLFMQHRMMLERRGVKAFMVGGSIPILLLSYHYLVRFTWVGAILNGRRHPRAGKLPPANAAPAL